MSIEMIEIEEFNRAAIKVIGGGAAVARRSIT